MYPAVKKWLFILALSFSLAFTHSAQATHIVGGELNYRYLGNNLYEISLTVYRDCYNGIPPFDNPASLGIFDYITFNLVTEVQLQLGDIDTVPPTVNSPCFIPPTNICYERTTYVDTISLPPSPGGYILAYQRCCRNYTILNIITPDATGATYDAWLAGTSTFSQNSNPVFVNWPPPFICAGFPFVFDHSATDFEGDSIVYELCTPLNGGDTINPMPQPPNAPPYNPVFFFPPYNVNNMLGGNPQLTIDPASGLLTCTPNTIGQFVIGVCAREFRNGILVGYTRRDFQLNVVPCPTLVIAAIQNPIINCGSNTVTFENFSINAGSYLWDFGVAGSNTDTSTDVEPVFTYPDTGTYTVTLIAYSFVNPGCADTTVSTVTVLPDYSASFSYSLDTCSNTYFFNDTSNTVSGSTNSWFWQFGDGDTAKVRDPSHTYLAPGTYQVTLIAGSSRGCADTVRTTINVQPLLKINTITPEPARCYGECNGSAIAQAQYGLAPLSFLWNDPLAQATANADSLCAGTYFVTVTDSRGCSAKDSVVITEPQPLLLQLGSLPDYCGGICAGTGTSSVSGGNGGYIYSWSDPQNQSTAVATGLCPGNYILDVIDSKGCTISDSVIVIYRDSVPSVNAIADTNVIFYGQSTGLQALTPSSGYQFSWTPSSGLSSSTSPAPLATPTSTTTYTVIATDPNGCTATDSVLVEVREVLCREPEIFIPTAFSPNADQKNDMFYIRGNTIESIYYAVYNRWGEKVFESNNKETGWDGSYDGKPATPDVYVYYVELTCYNKLQFAKKGNITLIR